MKTTRHLIGCLRVSLGRMLTPVSHPRFTELTKLAVSVRMRTTVDAHEGGGGFRPSALSHTQISITVKVASPPFFCCTVKCFPVLTEMLP